MTSASNIIWLAIIALLGGALVGLIGMIRNAEQKSADRFRTTYELFFPASMGPEQVLNFIRSLSGLPKPKVLQPTWAVSFERYSSERGERYFVHLPGPVSARLDELMYVHLDVSLEPVKPEDDPIRTTRWEKAIELGMRGINKPLNIHKPEATAASMDAQFKSLAPGEAVVLQHVLFPSHPQAPTEANKAKLVDNTYHVITRVGAVGERPQGMVLDVLSVFRSVEAPGTHFAARLLPDVAGRINRRSGTFGFPIYLNAGELSAVIGWPLTGGGVRKAKRLAPTVAHDGPSELNLTFGKSNAPKMRDRLIAMPLYGEQNRSIHIVGESGCLHPDTPILDPTDGSKLSVRERHLKGEPFHVLALSGGRIVVAEARPPVAYRKVPMYRLSDGHHSVTVTGQHRIWNGVDYQRTSELVGGEVRLPSIGDADLSALLRDVQSSSQTDEGSLVGCRSLLRLCDQPPREAADCAPAFAPLSAGVLGRSPLSSRMDGLVISPRHIRPYPLFALHARTRFAPSGRPFLVMDDPQPADTYWSTCPSHPYDAVFPSRTIRDRRAECTRRSAAASIGCSLACAEERSCIQQAAASASVGRWERWFESLTLTSAGMPAQEPYDASIQVEPFQVSSISYLNINTWTVEAAGDETYYDFHVPIFENYFAEGLFHHNSGKSVLLENLAVQIIARPDIAFLGMEPAGDLMERIAMCAPESSWKDIIYFDPLDEDYPIGINPLKGGDPEQVASHIVAMMKTLYKDTWSASMQRTMTTAVTTAALRGGTLYDAMLLLTSEDYRTAELRKLNRRQHPDLFESWDSIIRRGEIATDSTVNRFHSLMGFRIVRNVLSQREGLDFDKALREHKKILMPLPRERMGATNASVIGSIAREMMQTALMRQPPPASSRHKATIMLDEAQNYLSESLSETDAFAEIRKYGGQFILANQFIDQLGKLQQTVGQNVPTKVTFRTSPEEASKLKGYFGPLKEDDLSSLGKYDIALKANSSGGMAPTVTIHTPPPPQVTGFYQQIIESTRKLYAKPRAEVEADIAARHAKPEPRQRPKIGDLVE